VVVFEVDLRENSNCLGSSFEGDRARMVLAELEPLDLKCELGTVFLLPIWVCVSALMKTGESNGVTVPASRTDIGSSHRRDFWLVDKPSICSRSVITDRSVCEHAADRRTALSWGCG